MNDYYYFHHWIFHNESGDGLMQAHHLLASYLLVWLIQGGYAAWIVWQWRRTGKELQPDPADLSPRDEGS